MKTPKFTSEIHLTSTFFLFSVAIDLRDDKKHNIPAARLREMRKLGMLLMQDPGVRQCFACSYEFYLPDSAEYFSRRVRDFKIKLQVP